MAKEVGKIYLLLNFVEVLRVLVDVANDLHPVILEDVVCVGTALPDEALSNGHSHLFCTGQILNLDSTTSAVVVQLLVVLLGLILRSILEDLRNIDLHPLACALLHQDQELALFLRTIGVHEMEIHPTNLSHVGEIMMIGIGERRESFQHLDWHVHRFVLKGNR